VFVAVVPILTGKCMNNASLVTGAAGFIGSHLVDRLLALGHRVVGLDNLALGRRANLAEALRNKQFSFLELDVNDVEACLAFLRKEAGQGTIETVWHLAANSDIQAGGRDPDLDLRLTFLTTHNVLKMMRAMNIPQLVFASSSAIYGDHDGVLKEETGPLLPVSNYGAMKLASEGSITAALAGFLKRVWICRFPNVVGSRATHGVIFDLLKKLRANPAELEVLGDGAQEKPYLHVSELVDAMLFLFERSRERLNYYNIAPEIGATTVRFIAEAVVRAAVPGANIRYTGGSRGWVGDVPKFRYSTGKLKSLGWSPKLSSNQAVELAIRENL
jgi:UDP-glucose 4-epimerase